MKRRIILIAGLLLLPLASAAPGAVTDVTVATSNQRIDLSWQPASGAAHYLVTMYPPSPGAPQTINTTATKASFSVTNGRAYSFIVVAHDASGPGPASLPVAAVASLDRDMEYLAAGLIVTWLGIFGYAAFLSRQEAKLDRKLEQLLSHRQGRT